MKNENVIRQKIQHLKAAINEFADELENISNSIESKNTYTNEEVKRAVCKHFEITASQLSKKKVKGPVRTAKEVYCLLLFNHVTMGNKSEVSRLMGYNNENGCLYMLRNAQDNMESNSTYSRSFNGHHSKVKEILAKSKK